MKKKFLIFFVTISNQHEQAVSIALTLGVTIIIFGALWLLIWWGTPKENKMKYDISVFEVCIDPEMSTDLKNPLVTNSKIAVGIVGRAEVHEWQVALPDSRIPDETSEIDIVICVDEGREILDTCKYTGGTSYYIQKYNPEIFVFHEESKVGFDSASFQGAPPRFTECPWTYTNSDDFEGKLPTEDFVDWVRKNIP